MVDQLTTHQEKALKEIEQRFGDEWFAYWDLPHRIRRPLFTCEILEKKGYLEKRYVSRDWSLQFRRKAEAI